MSLDNFSIWSTTALAMAVPSLIRFIPILASLLTLVYKINVFIQEFSKNNVSIDDSGDIIKHTTIPKIESHLLKFKINKNGNFELIH